MSQELLLVTAEMGLGHIRALVPFEKRLNGKIHVLGQTAFSSKKSKRIWRWSLWAYELLSKANQWPIVGNTIFSLLNSLLYIPPISKGFDFKKPTFSVKMIEKYVDKGICDEISLYNEDSTLPVLTSFYAPVVYLSKYHQNRLVFCQICDTDLNRVWVPSNPTQGNIHYLAPCQDVVDRLLIYGVEKEKIHLTGFPMPLELIGSRGQEIAIQNYERRLSYLKATRLLSKSNPLKIAYVIGGTGAMISICIDAALSLSEFIREGEIEFTIISRPNKLTINRLLRFKRRHFKGVEGLSVIESYDRNDYFKKFNDVMADIHILWTKPSELTFYSSLGIPIIMAPPLGAQEEANRKWLLSNNIAVDQENPSQSHVWLIDFLKTGYLWPMAKNGWINGIRTSVFNVEKIVKEVN